MSRWRAHLAVRVDLFRFMGGLLSIFGLIFALGYGFLGESPHKGWIVLGGVYLALLFFWRTSRWAAFEFTGLRWMWERIRPPTPAQRERQRPAMTFTLWVVGTYTALYGIASQRYEDTADRIELRANAVVSLLSNDRSRLAATSQVAAVQRMQCLVKPEFFQPSSVIRSFLGVKASYLPASRLLIAALEGNRRNLGGNRDTGEKVDLSGAELNGGNFTEVNLTGANLMTANLNGAILSRGDLTGANLKEANLNATRFEEAILVDADLSWTTAIDAYFGQADLSKVYMSGANLISAYFMASNLERADLSGTDLSGSNMSSSNLSSALLIGADLTEAYLINANLNGTDLTAADLKGANLSHANLKNLQFWRDVKSWKGANIYMVKNAPLGFRNFVLDRGAVELDMESWEIYREVKRW